MAQKGEAARALSISAMSSLIGGLIGFAVLVASLPIMRELVMALSAPEYFLMAFMGLAFIALLSEGSFFKGMAAGGLGLIVAMVGVDPVSSVPRYTFGWLYLFDGLDIIPVVVGFFAVAQMIELARQGMEGHVSRSSRYGRVSKTASFTGR
jgi:putative tricarboxylic transport membrane protein